MDHPLSFHH